jgi:hypothetical protein
MSFLVKSKKPTNFSRGSVTKEFATKDGWGAKVNLPDMIGKGKIIKELQGTYGADKIGGALRSLSGDYGGGFASQAFEQFKSLYSDFKFLDIAFKHRLLEFKDSSMTLEKFKLMPEKQRLGVALRITEKGREVIPDIEKNLGDAGVVHNAFLNFADDGGDEFVKLVSNFIYQDFIDGLESGDYIFEDKSMTVGEYKKLSRKEREKYPVGLAPDSRKSSLLLDAVKSGDFSSVLFSVVDVDVNGDKGEIQIRLTDIGQKIKAYYKEHDMDFDALIRKFVNNAMMANRSFVIWSGGLLSGQGRL